MLILTILLLLANCSNLNLSPKNKMNGTEPVPLNADQAWARKMHEQRLARERKQKYEEKRRLEIMIEYKRKRHQEEQK